MTLVPKNSRSREPEKGVSYGQIRDLLANAIQHHRADRLQEAVKLYDTILQADPKHSDAWHLLGSIAHQLGKHDQAVDFIGKAIAISPRTPLFHYNLGLVLEASGKLDQAVQAFQQAIRFDPDSAEALNCLGKALKSQGRFEEAIKMYNQALRLKPDYTTAYFNLGNALKAVGRLDQATEKYGQVLRLKPDHVEAYNNLGNTLREQGRPDEAIENFNQALLLNPDYPEANLNRAICHLLKGDFAEGWEGYEWRLRKAHWKPGYDYDVPLWNGSSFIGKRLLVQDEQGIGDSLQFIRYLPMVKSRGGMVIFEAMEPLMGLLEGFHGIDQLVSRSSDAAPTSECDLYIPLLSLPGVFETTAETIPADVPYLFVDSRKVEYWRPRLAGEGFKVGLVWSGNPMHPNDRNRSCPLERFAPLAEVPNVQLYGLQKDEAAAAQVKGLPENMAVTNLGQHFRDFTDTAGVIENLDLLISVDTSVVHLAGAMGKPVWVLLALSMPDWRWLLDREDSPWYPTMRLFRQQKQRDWDVVIRRVAEELRMLMERST